MNTSDVWFLWCLTGSAAGYVAMAMALLGADGAVVVAIAAYTAIYVGHVRVKGRRFSALGPTQWAAPLGQALLRNTFVLSLALGLCSVLALVFYVAKWNERDHFPSLSVLIIAPWAYYGFACAKMVARVRRAESDTDETQVQPGA